MNDVLQRPGGGAFPSGLRYLLCAYEYDQNVYPGPPRAVFEKEVRELYGERVNSIIKFFVVVPGIIFLLYWYVCPPDATLEGANNISSIGIPNSRAIATKDSSIRSTIAIKS